MLAEKKDLISFWGWVVESACDSYNVDMVKIDDIISYIPACDEPLSADVGVIIGNKKTWIFDVGSSESALEEIHQIDCEKAIVISHFHPDHMGNLQKINCPEIYVGANTLRYSGKGTVVDSDLYIEDRVRLHLFPIPCCHAKGSLGLEVNEKYAFIGDATAPTTKAGKTVYNAQLLFDEIKAIEGLRAPYVLQSHRMDTIREKKQVVEYLKEIYARRQPNNPYIQCEDDIYA